MYNILLCDDEEDIVFALKIYLKNPDYCFYEAHNGKEALDIIKEHHMDLLLLDMMMPVMDGLTAMKEIRKVSNLPIIILTAKGESIDKIMGFDEGADDYITKPFDPIDVKNRVSAQIRRYTSLGSKPENGSDCVIMMNGIVLDDSKKSVTVNGEEVSLTFSEFEILKLLISHPQKCFSPKEIYKEVWKENACGSERAIAVHIRHLREKIEIDPANPRYINAVWGQGYRFLGGLT